MLYKLDIRDGMFWLFDIQGGACFSLNETSYFILSCFDGKTRLSEIRRRILSKYAEENSEKVSKDFEELFETLGHKGILRLVSNRGGKGHEGGRGHPEE